jgi:signal transduction histidine kinase
MKLRRERTNTPAELKSVKAFQDVSYRILQLANQGLLRADFQREVSKLVITFTGCDSVGLWLKDHGKYYPSKTTRLSKGSSKIDFRPFTPCEAIRTGSNPGIPREPAIGRPCKSARIIPVAVNRENVGLLQLMSREQKFFEKDVMEICRGLARILGIASIHRRIQVDLRERVKELTCLYGIARLGAQPELSLGRLLQGIVELLPQAWLYPEITSARIVLNGRSYPTPGFREGLYQQKAGIFVDGERRGTVDVSYHEEKPELDEGPFLKEERSLIDAVAGEVAIILKRRQGEEEKLRYEEQLRHADRLVTIGQLAAGVAHELNEPLGSILGFAELVRKSPAMPPQARQDVDKIFNASLYAREVVKKLLIFARQVPPRKIWVNLNQIVEEGIYFLEARFAKEGVKLVRSLDPNLPDVYADPSQLNQVLVNLVVNAVQAMTRGGTLSLQTTSNGLSVFLLVEDTGTGMSHEVLEKIFTPFFTTKDVGQGTGLGLPVVHGIISAHGGSIQVESKLGQGTRFKVQLPVKGPPGTGN